MATHQVMVFVGNGFDISVLRKYGNSLTTSYCLTDGKPAIYGTDNKPFNGGKTNHVTGGKVAPNNKRL